MVGTVVGSVGVGLLLIAFVLNLRGRLKETSVLYLVLNLAGSAMAAIYAAMTRSIPFVILESVWALAALQLLLVGKKKAPR